MHDKFIETEKHTEMLEKYFYLMHLEKDLKEKFEYSHFVMMIIMHILQLENTHKIRMDNYHLKLSKCGRKG